VRAEISEVKAYFHAEMSEVHAELKSMQLMIVMVLGLTFANPAFIELIKSVK
jgi:hypothetical protein